MYPESIQNLIKLFSKFPTVGPRTAARFVFYLTQLQKERVEELIGAINGVKNNIKICNWCNKLYENTSGGRDENGLCLICANSARDKTLVCIVEKEIDLEAIEKTNQYKGLYFILGGAFLTLQKPAQKQILEQRAGSLIKRIKMQNVKEIVIALNPTIEGQNTALWLKRRLAGLEIKTTQLGRGLPVGGELEYADEETLEFALQNRH